MGIFSTINIRSVVLALVPILGMYQIFGFLKLDFLLLTIVLILGFRSFSFNKEIALFFLVIIVISLFSFVLSIRQSHILFINNSLQIISFGILLSYYTVLKVNQLFIKTLLLLGVLSTLTVFYQSFSYHILSTPITFFLPFDQGFDSENMLYSISWGRPNSIFLEPAHYCIFILPIFYYSLKTNKKIISFILLLGILMSTSTTGLIGVLMLLFYRGFRFQKLWKYAIIFAIIFFSSILYFSDFVIILIEEILLKLNYGSLSTNIRTLGSFSLIKFLDTFSLWFGIGHNQLSLYMSLIHVEVKNYSNSYLMSFFSFGVLGFISFFVFIKSFLKVNPDYAYFLVLILVLVTDQILFNQHFFYLVSCIFFLNTSEISRT